MHSFVSRKKNTRISGREVVGYKEIEFGRQTQSSSRCRSSVKYLLWPFAFEFLNFGRKHYAFFSGEHVLTSKCDQ